MILYLDCASGISGDMLVAALLGLAGATEQKPGPLDKVVRPALKAAGIDKRLVSVRSIERGGVEALAFKVPDGPGFATFDELIMSMYASKLDQAIADGVAALAQRMADAEREVHGERVHDQLDELSGLDTAVDLISAVALMHHLAPGCVVASPPELGGGTIETAHGELEVPAPAVAVLLRGLPTAPLDESGKLGELTTPTGAALLAHFADEFGPRPAGPVAAAGAGAGSREVPGRPNVLRAFFIEPAPQEETMDRDSGREAGDDRTGAVRRTAWGIAGGIRRAKRVEPAPDADEAVAEAEAASEAEASVAGAELTGGEEPGPAAEESVVEEEPALEEQEIAEEPESVPEGDQLAAEPVDETPAAGVPDADESEPLEPETPAGQAEEAVASRVDELSVGELPVDEVPLDHVVLEANVDDLSPELLAHAAELLREAGALDVWITPALMKKGRPGSVVHVLAAAADRQRLADVLFAETTTFGLRVVPVGRVYAQERRETVRLGGHEIRVRLSIAAGRPATVSPEYEDCRRAAERLGRPARVVYEAAQAAARARFSGG